MRLTLTNQEVTQLMGVILPLIIAATAWFKAHRNERKIKYILFKCEHPECPLAEIRNELDRHKKKPDGQERLNS